MDPLAAPLRICAALSLVFLLAPSAGVAQHSPAPPERGFAERSLSFTPFFEEREEQSLDFFRTGLPNYAADRLAWLERDRAAMPGFDGALVPLDLFRSLAAYLHASGFEAQSLSNRVADNAPTARRAQSQAALLSALECFAHQPLRREDIHAGLARLQSISGYASSSAGITCEVQFWRGEGLRALDQFGQAESAYRAAIAAASDPGLRGLTIFRLAELEEREGRLAEADSNFELAAVIPDSPLVLLATLREAAVERRIGHLAMALANLDRADSIYRATTHTAASLDRDLGYRSLLIDELMLKRTPLDRIVGSSPSQEQRVGTVTQIASSYYPGEVELVRSSTLSGLGRYDEATTVSRKAEESIDSLRHLAIGNAAEARFVANALRFERAWSLFERAKYKEASSAFLELAVADTSTRPQSLIHGAASSFRERGEYFDPFLN